MATPVLVSWSGGKDAALALARLRSDPAWRVVGLLTSVVGPDACVQAQGIPLAIVEAQAAALGLPLQVMRLPSMPDNACYVAALAESLAAARAAHERALRHIAYGDLHLADVRAWREGVLQPLAWSGVFPLWGTAPQALAHEFIAGGHRAVLCRVDTSQLAAHYCGRAYDAHLLADLPASCDPCGERGEFHTCVHDGPLFAYALPLRQDGRLAEAPHAVRCALSLATAGTTG